MPIRIFQSAVTPELFGFTPDLLGTNLPAACGPWVGTGDTIPLGVAMASPGFGLGQQVFPKVMNLRTYGPTTCAYSRAIILRTKLMQALGSVVYGSAL